MAAKFVTAAAEMKDIHSEKWEKRESQNKIYFKTIRFCAFCSLVKNYSLLKQKR
jgi:hypothetical protein